MKIDGNLGNFSIRGTLPGCFYVNNTKQANFLFGENNKNASVYLKKEWCGVNLYYGNELINTSVVSVY